METRSLTTSIFLLFIISLPVFSLSLLLDGDGVVKPDDPYVYYGQTLELWCNITNPRFKENSSSLYFKLGEEYIDMKYVRIVNTRSIKLRFPVTEETLPCSERTSFNFLCFSKNQMRPLDHQLVKVDHEPRPVTNFKCRVYNWENMTCSWDLGVKYCNPQHVKVSLVWTVGRGQYDCPNMTKGQTSCSWLQSGRVTLQPDIEYNMKVLVQNNAKNKSETYGTEVFRIQTRNIVQPGPVENLLVSKIKNNSTCLRAQWTHSLQHRTRKYQVVITSEHDEIPMVQLFDKKNHYEICHLQPYTLYTIAVSNIPSLDGINTKGFYSDTVETSVRTPEDIPSGAPGLCSGCFTERLCEEVNCKRNIQIYWKPVNPRHQNGKITGYKVESFTESDGVRTIIILDDGTITSYTISLTSTAKHLITITAKTSRGFSNRAASLVIPAKSNTPKAVNDILVEAETAASPSYAINWSDLDTANIFNYTLYYCKRQDVVVDCRDEISWIHLKPTLTESILNLSKSESLYHIGISREVKYGNDILSSGIKWNKCVYIKNTKPKSALPNVRFPDIQPDQALIVEWDRLDCVDNVAFIKEYLLQVCPVKENNGNCIEKEKNITVPEHMTSYRIDHLIPFQMYKIVTRAVSYSGLGPSSAPISLEVIDNNLNTAEIAGICIAGLFVLALLLFAIFRCYRCTQNEKKKCKNLKVKSYLQSPPDLIDDSYNKFKNRPLPTLPSLVNTPGIHDSGYETSVPQYEPIGLGNEQARTTTTPRKGNDSITSETLLINNMESQDFFDHHKDPSPYAVRDISTKVQCGNRDTYPHDHHDSTGLSSELNSGGSRIDSYTQIGGIVDEEPKLDSYHQIGLNDSGCEIMENSHFNNLNNPITPQTSQIVNFVTRPQNVTIGPVKPVRKKVAPKILPTENSDTSDDYSDGSYLPHHMLNSPIPEHKPIVCELVSPVSPTGDIHNTQTLWVRRADPERPLSAYMHQLPLQYFKDSNTDEGGPTTEL